MVERLGQKLLQKVSALTLVCVQKTLSRAFSLVKKCETLGFTTPSDSEYSSFSECFDNSVEETEEEEQQNDVEVVSSQIQITVPHGKTLLLDACIDCQTKTRLCF